MRVCADSVCLTLQVYRRRVPTSSVYHLSLSCKTQSSSVIKQDFSERNYESTHYDHHLQVNHSHDVHMYYSFSTETHRLSVCENIYREVFVLEK